MKQKILFIFTISFMLVIIFFPKICMEGTKEGLILWYNSVLPSLLPYMILTNVLINTGVFNSFKTSKSFFSPYTIISIIIGFFCGYPMGAYIVANNYKFKKISKYTAYWLLTFINLSSPAFIIQYVVIQNLRGKYVLSILITIYSSAIITGLILLPYFYKKHKSETLVIEKTAQPQYKDVSACIIDSFLQSLKLCGYIVLFSITVKMVTAHINTVTIKHITLIGLLEQTNGIKTASNVIGINKLSASLIAMFAAFGSISCIFQTDSVCRGSGLNMMPYILSKVFQGALSFLIMNLII